MSCVRFIIFGELALCFWSLTASDHPTITYDLAKGVLLNKATTYSKLRQEIVKDFTGGLDRIEHLVVGPYKLRRYYISSELLSSDKVIPSDIIEAFALGDNPRLICKP